VKSKNISRKDIIRNSGEIRSQKDDFKNSYIKSKWVEEEMKKSEAHYRELFSSSPIGTALFDLDGKYLEVNDTYAKILGISKEVLLSKKSNEIIGEKELEKTQKDIYQLIAKGVTGGMRKLQVEDNNLVLSYVNTLLYDQEEKPVGIISMIQDITELKGPRVVFEEGHEFSEKITERKMEHLTIQDTDRKVRPLKRFFFNIFRGVPKRIEKNMVYEMENQRLKTLKLQGFLEKIIQKSIALDEFEDAHESPTIFRRISRRYL